VKRARGRGTITSDGRIGSRRGASSRLRLCGQVVENALTRTSLRYVTPDSAGVLLPPPLGRSFSLSSPPSSHAHSTSVCVGACEGASEQAIRSARGPPWRIPVTRIRGPRRGERGAVPRVASQHSQRATATTAVAALTHSRPPRPPRYHAHRQTDGVYTHVHAHAVTVAGTLAHVTGTGSNTAHGGSRVAR